MVLNLIMNDNDSHSKCQLKVVWLNTTALKELCSEVNGFSGCGKPYSDGSHLHLP